MTKVRDKAEPLPPVTRNNARDFACLTLKNLKYIRTTSHLYTDVHVVTQLANSLLGLIVFPFEEGIIDPVEAWSLERWKRKGWPSWTIHLDNDPKEKTKTLGRLVFHLRNAVAHRRLRFSSDSSELSKVTFHAQDAERKNSAPYWRASISGAHLLVFCEKLAAIIDDELG